VTSISIPPTVAVRQCRVVVADGLVANDVDVTTAR